MAKTQAPRRHATARVACAALFAATLTARAAHAAETSGRIFGRLTDPASGAPAAGLTVIVSGPQGQQASVSDDQGDYAFAALPVGTYAVVAYPPGGTPIERPEVVVSADTAVRVNLRVPRGNAKVETYVIERRVPLIDLGTARTGTTQAREVLVNLPAGSNFGEVLDRTPGAFFDRSGGVSIAGGTGLENVYLVDGMNVTGIEYGDILSGKPNSSGGSNLPLAFVEELSISSGGYAAEYGGAMGGVVNVVTKSGSNEHHGSASFRLSPSWLEANAATVSRTGSALTGVVAPGTESELTLEVGGPIIKDRLFYWVGLAPLRRTSAFVRDVLAQTDVNGDGMPDRDAAGNLVTTNVSHNETAQRQTSYPFGGKLTFVPHPAQRFNLGFFMTPSQSIAAFDRSMQDTEAAADPRSAMQQINKRNTDITASWTGHFFDRHLRLEGQLGLHDERDHEKSPYADLNELNQIEWHGTSLADLEGIAACRPVMRGMQTFDPCPLDVYHAGGYGPVRSYSAERLVAELKATHLFSLLGAHELKYGGRFELSVLDEARHFSGPAGSRGLIQNFPGNTSILSFFSLPRGRYPFQFADGAPGNLDPNGDGSPAELALAPYYQDELHARVKNVMPAFFLQDSYSPLPNLTVLAGARFENQRLYDHDGEPFASLDNLAFRAGAVYDFTNDGRSKLFTHYGRFYEAVPLNLAVRYFGGEGILIRNYDNTGCTSPPNQWSGKGEWQGCPLVAQNPPASSPYSFFNNGSNYPVQPNLRGQYHDEIVGGFEYEPRPGWLVGAEYTHRWLGAVIEDGTAASDFTFVLANPGQVPEESLRAAEADVAAKQQELDRAAPADRPARETELGALKSRLANLQGLAAEPKPERTYDALTVSLRKRLGRRLSVNAWYTYSRLYGNYNGLYDADNNYAAPNGSNAYDTPDLVPNKRGPLANDRPHSGRITAFYEQPLGTADDSLVGGLVFAAYSGVPRNYTSALIPGQQLVFLLPRGQAGRTPTVTQLDAKLAYRHQLSKLATVELSLELFNVFNSRTPLREDDNYTFDMAAAIVGGRATDLAHAKNIAGAPITPNANFGHATAYQAPFHGRMGLRAFF